MENNQNDTQKEIELAKENEILEAKEKGHGPIPCGFNNCSCTDYTTSGTPGLCFCGHAATYHG